MSGVVKQAKKLLELRVHFCQTSVSSQGIREYIGNKYPSLKKENPTLPILIREARGVEARVFGRYEKGKEVKVILENLDASQVENKIKTLF